VWVNVPMTMVQRAAVGQPQQIGIVLANASGTSTGTLVARSDGSAMRVFRAAPGVLQQPAVRRPPVARPPTTTTPAPAPHP
jgi:hypothetical protein